MNRVHEELAATILLMRRRDGGTDLSSYDISLISQNLSRPLELLNAICPQLADYKLMQKSTVPT